MKPLPTHISDVRKAPGGEIPPHAPAPASGPAPATASTPGPAPALATAATPYSSSNRRATTSRAYPWLLFASTAVAGLFCLLYITKPVIQTVPGIGPETSETAKTTPAAATPGLMQEKDHLPAQKTAAPAPRDAGVSAGATQSPFTAFEQTNLRVQHILTAETPGGHLAKIDLDVPVLYQSRNLRWTAAEVAEARGLLARLTDYQEKSRMLRAEGVELLDSWNRLIEHSIPTGILRADSPTLPTNQQDAADAPRPAILNTNELIQIQPAGK